MRTGSSILVDKMSNAACRMLLIHLVFIGNSIFAQTSVKKADADTLKLVEFFLKTPTVDLPPNAIGAFMAVDPETLPEKLRPKYLAKHQELMALKHIAEGKRKPPIRRLGMDPLPQGSCDGPTKMPDPRSLSGFGFVEIMESEEQQLMQDTKCTECELIKEFSLTLTERVQPKNGKAKDARPRVYYFLHENDPLNVLVEGYRHNRKAFGTNFFGTGHPSCR